MICRPRCCQRKVTRSWHRKVHTESDVDAHQGDEVERVSWEGHARDKPSRKGIFAWMARVRTRSRTETRLSGHNERFSTQHMRSRCVSCIDPGRRESGEGGSEITNFYGLVVPLHRRGFHFLMRNQLEGKRREGIAPRRKAPQRWAEIP